MSRLATRPCLDRFSLHDQLEFGRARVNMFRSTPHGIVALPRRYFSLPSPSGILVIATWPQTASGTIEHRDRSSDSQIAIVIGSHLKANFFMVLSLNIR